MIVADVLPYRERLATTLGRYASLDVVGVAARAAEAIGVVAMRRSDVAIVDMAISDSVPLLEDLRAGTPDIRRIAFTIAETSLRSSIAPKLAERVL